MSYVEKTDTCWDWTGAALPRGYGRFYFRGKPRYAHRVSVELFTCRQVADHEVVMHACDRPCCVNPDHLSVGSHADNMRDASAKGRIVRVQNWNGPRNPRAKLSVTQTEQIRLRALAGEPAKILAAEFGVSTVRVGQIRRARA